MLVLHITKWLQHVSDDVSFSHFGAIYNKPVWRELIRNAMMSAAAHLMQIVTNLDCPGLLSAQFL